MAAKVRIISLSVKLTATTVVLVMIVAAVLAAMTLKEIGDDVEAQTDRLVRIRTAALDRVGGSTSRYLAMPAASPMYDTDRGALYGLVLPAVREESDHDVVFGYIVDNEGVVWMAAVDNEYSELYLPGTGSEDPFFADTGDERAPTLPETVPAGFIAQYAGATTEGPLAEEVVRRLVTQNGTESERSLKQYTAPIVDRTGKELGYLTLAYSLEALEREVIEIRDAGEVKKDALRQRIAILGGIAVVLGSIIAILQALAITRNVKKLSRAANQIAKGDLSVRADVAANDEIGVLGRQFNVMADRVQALLVETEEKASLERELDIARMIQETLLPNPGPTESSGVRFSGYFRAASVCGGDFWQWDALPDGRLLLTIGDVTGHGVPSAMLSAAAKSGLDTLISVSAAGGISLPTLLHELNNTIIESAQRKFFMTFLAMLVDPRTGKIELASAGHNFPLLVRARDGKCEVRPLVARGNRLGDDRSSEFEVVTGDIVAGDLLFLYTDGLTEYRAANGEEYGEKRLRRLLTRIGREPAESVLQQVLDDLSGFVGSAPIEDDITIVVAKV